MADREQRRQWEISWITAQANCTEHAVTDDAHVAGMAAGDGVYEALCGAEFLAACMDVGPCGECSCCRAFLRARVELRDLHERMSRPGWFSRLFCHHKQPADVGSPRPPAPTSAGPQDPSAGAGSAPSELAPAGARRRGRHAA